VWLALSLAGAHVVLLFVSFFVRLFVNLIIRSFQLICLFFEGPYKAPKRLNPTAAEQC
jgi:hypothetical protein